MKSDAVGSPERSAPSPDAVIACVVRSQKRGVNSTRGNYDSANYMGYRRAAWPGHSGRRGRFPLSAKGVRDPNAPSYDSTLSSHTVPPGGTVIVTAVTVLRYRLYK